jgi:hypothetical protein
MRSSLYVASGEATPAYEQANSLIIAAVISRPGRGDLEKLLIATARHSANNN